MENQQHIIVHAENCKIGFQAQPVLIHEINMTVRKQELAVILGGNGTGKTTLLRTVLGLNKPMAGQMSVLGAMPRKGNPKIGYLPQSATLESSINLTGYSMVAAAVKGWKIGVPYLSTQQRRAVEKSIEQVGAQDYAKKPFAQLSGGQKQRLRLAQSLVNQPDLLLLDEPLTHLDPESQQNFVKLLCQMQRDEKTTVLMVTHDMSCFSSGSFKAFTVKNKILSMDVENA